ncbi:MAG: glycosyltransferase family 61 protein [Ruminococcus flavefaciens]|nr:glycosyltransferase family 61 protein [Ruminococcus flavefaciens]
MIRIIALPFVLVLKGFRGIVALIRQLSDDLRQLRESRQKKGEEARQKRRKKREQRRQKKKKPLQKKDSSKIPLIFRRIYRRTKGLVQKSYWFLRIICRKMYWFIRTRLQRLYWFSRTRLQKVYWFGRTRLQKVYWFGRTRLQKLYWFGRTRLQKVYWFGRTRLQWVYWNIYYPKSRKLYQTLCKSAYINLFFVFFREYIKPSPTKTDCAKIIGIREYAESRPADNQYQVLESGKQRPVCIPEYFEEEPERVEFFQSPDIYIAELTDVSLVGGSNVITARNILLNDAVFYDQDNRIDIRYSAIKNVFDGIAIIENPKVSEEIEKGINLTGAASFNYYHLVVEILSRLIFADRIAKYQEYPILVDEVVLKIPQFHAALDCINRLRHPIIKIEKGKKYLVKDFVQPSPTVWMPTNVYHREQMRTEDFMISDTVLKTIRESVGVWQERPAWRNIFISRKNTQAVRLKNEEEVRNLFAQEGFEIIYTEEMTFRQQVECFGQAKCVVAATGAALTNMIFCQPETLIGCIIPAQDNFCMYSTIGYLLKLKLLFLDAEITEMTPYISADTFVLDIKYAKRYIKAINQLL